MAARKELQIKTMKKSFLTVICILFAFILPSVISGCKSNSQTKSYLILYSADDSTGDTILDPSNYTQPTFGDKAPDPDRKELTVSFRSQEYDVSFYRSQFAGDGNYFYDYKSETGEIFTVDVNGMTVGIKRSFSSINENKTYDDWFEVVGFDDPYTNKPSTVTIKNPHNDKEYTLKRQG